MEEGVLVFGASRGVGLEVARLLRCEGRPVNAMLCGENGRAALGQIGVDVTYGDAFDAPRVEGVVLGSNCRTIVSTLGGRNTTGRRVDFIGNRNVIDAAIRAGADRFVLLTSIGCGDMAPFMSARAVTAFGEALKEKTKAEEHLSKSGLRYTILRPGGLKSEPRMGGHSCR